MKKRHIIILVALVVVIATFTVMGKIRSNLGQLPELAISNVDLSVIEDGIYSGSYNAFPISAEVKVTVNNHKIIGIELVKHNNSKGAPAEIIPDNVVKAQDLDVDVVTSATYSSKVILKAIENALNLSK